MKDLGKQTACTKSPVQEVDVVTLFASNNNTNNNNLTYNNINNDNQQSNNRQQENNNQIINDDNQKTMTNDDDKVSDKVMDNHLKELQMNEMKGGDPTRNIAQYMKNLKEKHLEYVELDFSRPPMPPPKKEFLREGSSDAAPSTTETSKSSDESPGEELQKAAIIDRKVDKVFTGERRKSSGDRSPGTPKGETAQTPKKILKSPRQSIELSRSPDRSKSQGNSPVKIYRVKEPKEVARLTVIKQSSRDKSPETSGKRSPSAPGSRRSSETGILKRSASPVGILKRSGSPVRSHSPDRNIRKTLSPCGSFDVRSPKTGLSPRGSICEARSPDRERGSHLYVQPSLSPHSSFDRSPDHCYDHPRLWRSSPRESEEFRDRSPERTPGRRSLSASARSSFDSQRSQDRFYKFSPYPSFEYTTISPEPQRRQSKSLERQPKDSFEYYGMLGILPPGVYHRQDSQRSYSDETILAGRPMMHPPVEYPVYSMSSESISRHPERPACVECLYTRKPS